MLIATSLGFLLKPTFKIAEQDSKLDLETMIPKQFSEWQQDQSIAPMVVNPELQQSLDEIYTQVLTRIYVNKDGYRIMLSIPYGKDQSDDLAAHDPKGCYSGQGFQILSNRQEVLNTLFGDIPVRRMEASMPSRDEPVTYWFMVGEYAVNNDWERKKAQFRYALKGQIPDGILFRISSIDADSKSAYQYHSMFVEEILREMSPEYRAKVSGLRKHTTVELK